MLRESGCSFGKSPHFSFPVSSVSKQFLRFPLFLETRDSSYISKGKKTTTRQTNHFRLRPQSVAPSSSTPPTVLSAQVTCTPAFLCPRSQRRPTPRICFYMRVMTRGSAQLCSLGTKSVWNPDGGRTAAEISCDSDLRLLLLQGLCRAAPLPPLLPEHTGIPFNSLFLPVVKYSLLPSNGHSANCIPLPVHRGHYFPLKMPVCHM